jgi:hypothetical protein
LRWAFAASAASEERGDTNFTNWHELHPFVKIREIRVSPSFRNEVALAGLAGSLAAMPRQASAASEE